MKPFNKSFSGKHVDLNFLLSLYTLAKYAEVEDKKLVNHNSAGTTLSYLHGRGMEFAEVRSYQPGDDIRCMEWRVTAKTGKPHTKLYQQEKQKPVYIMVDLNASMFFGSRVTYKSSLAKQAAVLFAFAAQKRHDDLRGFIFSGRQIYRALHKNKKNTVLLFAKMLADFIHPDTVVENRFQTLLTNLAAKKIHGTQLIFISDFNDFNEQAKNSIKQLRYRNTIDFIFVYDKLEQSPPPPNRYAIANGTEYLIFDTAVKSFCNAYADQFTKKIEALKKFCKETRIALKMLHPQEQMNALFRQQCEL